ncbi:hypothetical protein HRI_000459100 [Hibiscus trionum]|uniref:MADS-box domain-containing protein n=1 Tax=Hibiscus trionum TaxID=183268 RepID=A0A9W7H032_HIBTR|nr:hypothetical protein HRI_000459100 [Hibiscus trionum]
MAGSEKRKIDDASINQGALSKRRACLLRKASEISVNCNADVALAAFSPCGRFCKFFSLEKIRHVLERYIKLPPEKRHQEYEVENGESASLSQVSSCEKNLQLSLQEIKDRKERSRKERSPSMGQTRHQQRSRGRQSSFVYNSGPGKQVLNRGRQNLSSSLRRQHDLRTYPYRAGNGLHDRLYQPRGISAGSPGASSSSAGYTPIYRLVSSYVTHQNAIPLVFPTIQTLPGIPNLQNWRHGNSSMQQPIMGNPAIPCVPFQQSLRALGTSNLYQPRMPGMMNLQMGLGGLGSSSVNQSSMGNGNTTSNVHFQHQLKGVLGITLLGQHANDESFRGGGNTANGQLQSQQQGVLGNTSAQVNNVPFGGQQNQTPTSYNNHNPQNGVSTMPLISQLQVNPNPMNLLCSPNYNTMQNFDVTPPLNTESPNCNALQDLDVTSFLNSESPNCNILHDLDVTPFINSESPNCNTLQDLDVSSFFNSESPNCNTLQDFDVTSFFNSESPNCNTPQDLDVSTFLNSQSPDCNTLQDLDVTSFFNSESPNCNTLPDLDISSFFNSESPDCNTLQDLDVTSFFNFESSDYNTQQNLDVTPPLNSESPNSNTMQNLDVTPLNFESTPQNLDVTPTLNSESPNYNRALNLDVTPPLTSESSLQNLDVTPTSISESPNYNTVQNSHVTPFLNSESIPIDGEDNNVNNGNTDNSSTNISNNNDAINNKDTNKEENPQPDSPSSIFINNLLSISPESFFSIPIDGEDNNVNNGNTDNSSTNINNTIGNNDTNGEKNPQPESPCSIFINSLLNELAMEEGTSKSAANKEGNNSMERDNFGLPDNMTLEDFYMLF